MISSPLEFTWRELSTPVPQGQHPQDQGALTVRLCWWWGFHCCFLTQPCQSCSWVREDLGKGSLNTWTGVLQSIPGEWHFTFITWCCIFDTCTSGWAEEWNLKPTPSLCLLAGCPVECQVCISSCQNSAQQLLGSMPSSLRAAKQLRRVKVGQRSAQSAASSLLGLSHKKSEFSPERYVLWAEAVWEWRQGAKLEMSAR